MPNFELRIFEYDSKKGTTVDFTFEDKIKGEIDNGENVKLVVNRGGLITLATHLLTLAQEGAPDWNHLHYDPGFHLGDDSCSFIIEMREPFDDRNWYQRQNDKKLE